MARPRSMKFVASLLPHDRATVFLSPRQIEVVTGKRGGPAQAWPCAQLGAQEWSGALAALGQWASDRQRSAARRLHITLVISDHWVRYAVLPADRGRLQRDEQEAFARAMIAERFGAAWESAQIRIGHGTADEGILAAAVPSELLEELHTTLDAHAVTCAGVLPRFSHDLDTVKLESAASHALYASLEPGRIVLALAGPDGWHWIQSPLSGEDPTQTLERELAREQALMPPDEALPLFVFAHGVRLADRLDPSLRVVLQKPN